MVERETALVARDNRALRDGQPASALVLLDEHRAQFSNAQLTHERVALEVLSLCAVGRPSRASSDGTHRDARALALVSTAARELVRRAVVIPKRPGELREK